MTLEYKQDFQRAVKQWELFWKGENIRPNISIIIPKPGRTPKGCPGYLEGRDGNFQPVIDKILTWYDSFDYIGEAIPFFFVEWGPNTFSTFLGADLKFTPENGPNTSWCIPFLNDWDNPDIRFRRNSYWWQLTISFFKELKRQCNGKLLINPPTIVANLDSLAAIRGTDNLLMDLVLCPDNVRQALHAICVAHDEVLEEYSKELCFDMTGSISIEGTYCNGKHSRPQCDISCMISPEMFCEFVKPCLQHEAKSQDAFVYHLDGSSAIKHLETLCSIDKLDMISWVPSAGNDQNKDWYWLHKKIDELGKGQIIHNMSFAQIKQTWRDFKSKKLFFTAEASSKSEAEDFIADLEMLRKNE